MTRSNGERGGVYVELSFSTRVEGNYTVLSVGGEIDIHTAPQLRQRLFEIADSGASRIVVDLQQVDFMDSTGLGELVGALRRARPKGGDVRLVCTQEKILKIFRITALDQQFAIHETVDGAVAAG